MMQSNMPVRHTVQVRVTCMGYTFTWNHNRWIHI